MVLRNLRIEYPHYYAENPWLPNGHVGSTLTPEKRDIFLEKWKTACATVLDWVDASAVDIHALEQPLTGEQQQLVDRHQKKLYDWWLEFKVQRTLMKNLQLVLQYAPFDLKQYAELELAKLNKFVAGDMSKWETDQYKRENSLSLARTFPALVATIKQVDYISLHDIHNRNGYQEAEALVRYQSYLAQIVVQGLYELTAPVQEPDEFSFPGLWPGILSLSKNLTVEFITHHRAFKEEEYVDYTVRNLSGATSGWALKEQLKQLFQPGFEKLLESFGRTSRANQIVLLTDIKQEVEDLLSLVEDGKYVERDTEYGPGETYHFKRFSELKYKGDDALHFVFDTSSRAFLDKKLQEYALGWMDGIQEISRKLEHMLNNLELLIYRPQPTYNIDAIFAHVFVLESEEAALQGTAFHLEGVGIITCDHCVRNPTTGTLCTDLLVFRRDYTQKVRVAVVKSHAVLDVAILRVLSGEEGFLQEGLPKGQSDDVKPLDFIAVAGFPNYNFGDSGYFTTGEVTGFKKISSVPHILVNNQLVAGNSGGPGLDADGRVIGIVNIGADNFEAATTTEKHGLVPINVLDLCS